MSESTEATIERLEEQLERAEQTLSGLRPLDQDQARRVAERMDRLNSQLLALSEPPSLRDAHDRMETHPASAEDLDTLAEEMGSPDGEG
jgi:hypothetical protein